MQGVECVSCRLCAYIEILAELCELGWGQFLVQQGWGDRGDLFPPFPISWLHWLSQPPQCFVGMDLSVQHLQPHLGRH